MPTGNILILLNSQLGLSAMYILSNSIINFNCNIKMKSPIILAVVLSISLFSCAKETPQVKHKSHMASSKENMKNVQVVNEEDPICHMKTANFLKDTAVYKNKTYGFCSSYCKDEFKKNPESYAQK
ncbi:YHS domain-containing protein [Chryseobacterium indologenes]|nr:hypothetical protein CIN01S_04_04620 [Chryseobacterium indologenes NBRC 14944]SFJ54856.1 YHS domain-containing protein [Chryseobacterium indologenes]SUX52386.1 Uncharacterized protein conserved in bacteria [Chryseobacterium indologenes]